MRYLKTTIIISITFLISCTNYNKKETIYFPFSDSIPQLEYYYKKSDNNYYLARECRYYETGQLKYEGFYDKNEKKTGKWTYYFNNGKIMRIEHYKNGMKNGKMQEWYYNGKPMFKASYKNDLPHGKWIVYDYQGKKQGVLNYKNGQLIK